MFLFALLVAVACDDSDDVRQPVGTEPPASTAAATPEADLPDQIGVRAMLPTADPIDLAARFGRTSGRAPATKPFAGEANLGDQRHFSVLQLSGATFAGQEPPIAVTVSASLLAKSEHAYFYAEDAIAADPAAFQRAAASFEERIWPVVTGAFGLPASPGVDGDPRIIVLQADLGAAVSGYFNGDDLFLRAVRPNSNEAEMVYLGRNTEPGGAAFDVVLAHEFQHLIHRSADFDEEVWVNEGMSEVASLLVGGAGSSIDAFANRPGVQLNAWDFDDAGAHYGAGSAFFRYLSSRFGGDLALGEIARNEGDGPAGVEGFLKGTGLPLTFRDVFADWIAANVLDREVGPYANPARPVGVVAEEELVAGQAVSGEVRQFGTVYYRVAPGGEYMLRFSGEAEVPVLTIALAPGETALWGNAGDSIDTRLTREVDLTDVEDSLLSFRTWFDIERWFDWAYVAVSTDGGDTWEALAGEHTSTDDPVGVAYGPGYTGKSGEDDDAVWVEERISLAPYAGRKILLRFEYVPDIGTHGEGWLVDDVAVDGTDFRDDDGSDPGWHREGWVRLDRPLPQEYIVRVIGTLAGEPEVIDVTLDEANTGELRFDSSRFVDVTVVVAGATEGTVNPAPYTIELAVP